jgi:hypothetical protein
LFLKLLLEPNWEYRLSPSDDTSVDLKLTEVLSAAFIGFEVGAPKPKLNEAKLKLLERTDNRWLNVFTETREVTDEGNSVTLDTVFAIRLKVVRNQLDTDEATAAKEKFTLKADIRLKLPEVTYEFSRVNDLDLASLVIPKL